MDITARTPIHATEDRVRVLEAILRVLPGEPHGDGIEVRGHDPQPLRERIWELRIIDTVRSALLGGCEGSQARLVLSKQALVAGKVSLPPSSHPLGDVAVTFRVAEDDPWDDAEAFAWWLCPETEDGQIIGPV